MIDVTFVQRHPQRGNFSLERLFPDIIRALPSDIRPTVWQCPAPSRGIVPRVRNTLAAARHQGTVTHVTGDVNYAVLLMRPARTVLTIPDVVMLHRFSGWRRAVAKSLWFDLPSRRVARVIAISEFVRSEVLETLGCAPEHVITIHVPIGPQFVPDPRPFSTAPTRVLMIGSAWNKNLVRQTEALRDLPVEVDFVGELSDEHRAAFARTRVAYTQSYGLTDAEILERYQRTDLLLFASTYEGFGMPIVEAQAVGRPVITGRTSAMPEVAGEAACFVDATSVEDIRAGVQRVIDDAGYRAGLVANGYINAARFTPERIAAQHAELYREIVRKSR